MPTKARRLISQNHTISEKSAKCHTDNAIRSLIQHISHRAIQGTSGQDLIDSPDFWNPRYRDNTTLDHPRIDTTQDSILHEHYNTLIVAGAM